jgi:hypothetical protein
LEFDIDNKKAIAAGNFWALGLFDHISIFHISG